MIIITTSRGGRRASTSGRVSGGVVLVDCYFAPSTRGTYHPDEFNARRHP